MNFTAHAQEALRAARSEAERFNQNCISTEHILLGLASVPACMAMKAMESVAPQVDLSSLRLAVERTGAVGSDLRTVGNLPYTPRVKKILAIASTEARAMEARYKCFV